MRVMALGKLEFGHMYRRMKSSDLRIHKEVTADHAETPETY
jgi:hypothetical protein